MENERQALLGLRHAEKCCVKYYQSMKNIIKCLKMHKFRSHTDISGGEFSCSIFFPNNEFFHSFFWNQIFSTPEILRGTERYMGSVHGRQATAEMRKAEKLLCGCEVAQSMWGQWDKAGSTKSLTSTCFRAWAIIISGVNGRFWSSESLGKSSSALLLFLKINLNQSTGLY